MKSEVEHLREYISETIIVIENFQFMHDVGSMQFIEELKIRLNNALVLSKSEPL